MSADEDRPTNATTPRTTIHVVPDGEDWAVEVEGDGVPTSSFLTEKDAIAAGRDLARRRSADLEVHGADGEVKLRDTYGKMPD